jgi:hypothetical protein
MDLTVIISIVRSIQYDCIGLFSQYIVIIAKRVGLKYKLLDITLINLLHKKKASVSEGSLFLKSHSLFIQRSLKHRASILTEQFDYLNNLLHLKQYRSKKPFSDF